MSQVPFSRPIEDEEIPKVKDEVAVGEDLAFQRKWWRFEHVAWTVLALMVVADLLGAFGRGPLANAKLRNDSMEVKYERVERSNSPSIMRIEFAPEAIHDGTIQLFVSESMVDRLGNRRIVPEPKSSTIGNGGITYEFAANGVPATVQFALQPAKPGHERFTVGVPGQTSISAGVFVMP